MAVSGTRPIDRGTKIRAKSHLAHAQFGSARKQSQRTIAFHYIDLRAAVTGTRRVAVQGKQGEGRDSTSSHAPLGVSCARSRARFTITSVVSVPAADK